MKRINTRRSLIISGLGLALSAGCAGSSAQTEVAATEKAAARPELGSFGVDLSTQKPSVDPGDDFFEFANGSWLDSYELKPDEMRYGAFIQLRYRSEERVKAIIDELASGDARQGSLEQKIGDYFASFMAKETLDQKGISPLQGELDKIASITDADALIDAFGRGGKDETQAPISGYLGIDRKNPDRFVLNIAHSGLGLPDRDYYLEDTERFKQVRAAYEKNIAKLLGFTGLSAEESSAAAKSVLALEAAIAEHHWPRAELRNRDKTYNPFTLVELQAQFPSYPWSRHLSAAGIDTASIQTVNVNTPSALEPIAKMIGEVPLETWKHYLAYHLVANHGNLLGDEIDNAVFEFYGKELNGQLEQRERWKRAVNLVSDGGGQGNGLGEALGKIYVERYFPPSAKKKMDELVENLRAAFRERVATLDWMGEETKKEAFAKLESFNPKIGYPSKWRDFSTIEISRDDLLGNYRAVRDYWYQDFLERLSQPTDKDEWFMTPQTVNAYYNSSYNEIVFPAAILQPPFFDPNADPAVNYGAIGAVIGHEMGHGFDDQGSKSDSAGVQRNWWTDEDRKNFEARTKSLIEQYNAYSPLDGESVNGELTLGENIGDLGGLSMAYHAYKISLNGKEAPVIDGLTGDQRFFLAWAQVWRAKNREAFMLRRIKSDPHSPERFRVNGVVRNMDAWYAAFDIKPDADLYLEPEERVAIW